MENITCPLIDMDVRGFSCGNPSIDQQIRESYYATLLKQAYGYQIKAEDKTVGYYMLYFKNINTDIVNDIMDNEFSSGLVDYYIAVHIRYLAIDKNLQHQGIGTVVLKGIIQQIISFSKIYPIRIITLDALMEYYEWYKGIGFRDIPGGTDDGIIRAMYMDCMDMRELEKLEDYCELCL